MNAPASQPSTSASRARRDLTLLFACLALPTVLVYWFPLLVYQPPFEARLGEQIIQLSAWSLAAALLCAGFALIVWIGAPLLLARRMVGITPIRGWMPVDGLALFWALTALGLPAGVVHALVELPPSYDNLLQLASLMLVAGFGLGSLLQTRLTGNPSAQRWIRGTMVLQLAVLVLLPLLLGYLSPAILFLPVGLFLYLRGQPRLATGLTRACLYLTLAMAALGLLQAGKSAYRTWLFGGEFRRLAWGGKTTVPVAASDDDCLSAEALLRRLPVPSSQNPPALAGLRAYSETLRSGLDKRLVQAVLDAVRNGRPIGLDLGRFGKGNAIGRETAGRVLAAVVEGDIFLEAADLDGLVAMAHLPASLADAGASPAVALALAYEDGGLIPRDLTVAARLYIQMASTRPSALARLGVLLESGRGVEKDLALSLNCFQRSAELGDADGWRAFVRRAARLSYSHATRQRAQAMARDRGDAAAAQALSLSGALLGGGRPDTFQGLLREQQRAHAEFDVNRGRLFDWAAYLDAATGGAVSMAARRLNQLDNLAVAIQEVPGRYEPLGWQVYPSLLTWPIPRLLWEDKPIEVSGLLIGKQLGLAKPGDAPVAWSMPLLVEAWLAGGLGFFLLAVCVFLGVELCIYWLGALLCEVGIMTVTLTGLWALANGVSSGLAATCAGAMQAVIVVFAISAMIGKMENYRCRFRRRGNLIRE